MVKFNAIRVPFGVKGAQVISYKGGLYLSTLHASKKANYKPLYMIEIELDQDVLQNALSQFNTYKDSGLILVNLSTKKAICNQANTNKTLLNIENISHLYHENSNGTVLQSINNKKYYFVYSKSNYLNMVLIRYIPEEIILMPINNFYIWVWIFSISAIGIFLIYYFSTYNMMHRPLKELVKAFRKLENGDLQAAIKHDNTSEFGYLFSRFNEMVKNLNMLIDQVYKEKILMQRAELKHLQSQINPHFLYNSFFMINTMAKVGDENLIEFSKYLGEYFRFVTRNSSDYILLADEVNHALVYSKIQLMRFSRRFVLEFEDCPEKVSKLKVPRLILQPIIENAFEYSIAKKKNNGIIKICFQINNEELNIITEDNGSELSDDKLFEMVESLENINDNTEITGLINIHRRLKLNFGGESGLQYLRSELGGLKVVLKISLLGVDNYVKNDDR